MEKIYPYLDIIFLVLLAIFLLFIFLRLLGKKIGIQKRESLETININNKKFRNPSLSLKDTQQPVIEVFAEGSLNYKLQKIKDYVPNFNDKDFINYSKEAFKKIITNFNNGNIESIKDLLSSHMYESFDKYIKENNINNNVTIEKFLIVDISDIIFEKDSININIKFVTKQNINDISKEFREIWCFSKSLNNNDNNWVLNKVINE